MVDRSLCGFCLGKGSLDATDGRAICPACDGWRTLLDVAAEKALRAELAESRRLVEGALRDLGRAQAASACEPPLPREGEPFGPNDLYIWSWAWPFFVERHGLQKTFGHPLRGASERWATERGELAAMTARAEAAEATVERVREMAAKWLVFRSCIRERGDAQTVRACGRALHTVLEAPDAPPGS